MPPLNDATITNENVAPEQNAPIDAVENGEEAPVEPEMDEATREQKKAEIVELMADGKRELRAANFDVASTKFGAAAELTALIYGEFAAESFEPNFMYGRAMVELSAVENDLFKTALVDIKTKEAEAAAEEKEAGDESMTEEEEIEVREMVADALAEGAAEIEKTKEEMEADEKKDDTTTGTTTDETKEETIDDKNTEETVESTENKDDNEESKEDAKEDLVDTEKADEQEDDDEEVEDEEDEDEIPSAQLAFETLEVAAKIAEKMYEETKDNSWKKKRADVYVQLAQCATADEKYDEALEELGNAREILKELDLVGDRLVAEISFHEGRINSLRNEFVLAAESYKKAVVDMQAVIDRIRGSGDLNEEQKDEVKDLEEIINTLKEKADDAEKSSVQKELMSDMKKEESAQPTVLTSSSASNSDPSTNDITGLVRKKRAHDDSEVDESAKKAKADTEEDTRGEENVSTTVNA